MTTWVPGLRPGTHSPLWIRLSKRPAPHRFAAANTVSDPEPWKTSAPGQASSSLDGMTGGSEVQMGQQSAPNVRYDGERVLVTGGASFIGSHLVELLASRGRARHCGRRPIQWPPGQPRARLPRMSQLRWRPARPRVRVRWCAAQDTVFHLAAMHGGRGYIDTHPVECTNNMLLDHVVFSAAASGGRRTDRSREFGVCVPG